MSVIEIGALRIQREQVQAINGKLVCRHNSLSLNREGHVIRCKDCGDQVEPFWAFEKLVESYNEAQQKFAREVARHREEMAKGVATKAARRVEEAWRSRSMVPTCPHCNEAIFAEDGFGGAAVNRDLAMRRRQIAAKKAGDGT
ncbi:hypothetical protein [Malikia sp.]|uniref:hypothetical protein n=1 Tax=Malikia sp. TaxID=2070706 RepID=UPI0026023D2E|nr:hypothetical protein [Malikia sp.]MDD2730390.1 hypothetical protein [Malikia sp.]